MFDSERTTTYEETRKKGLLICRDCGSTFLNGRWTWDPAPLEAKFSVCPACQRIQDQYPAGIITLGGNFVRTHFNDIRNLIESTAEVEQSEHPMERLMNVRKKSAKNKSTSVMEVTTTGSHLARRIGEALHSAFEGELNIDYKPETFVRVSWIREE